MTRPYRLADNFYDHADLDLETDCLVWRRALDTPGYGQITVNGKKTNAHKHAWELEKGPIPPGMCVCHTCDNRACINTDHMFLASQRENIRDMDRKGRRGKRKAGRRRTAEEVREIRRRLEEGETVIGVARAFGMHRQQIRRIRDRMAWADLT